jgi:hypothetical protein
MHTSAVSRCGFLAFLAMLAAPVWGATTVDFEGFPFTPIDSAGDHPPVATSVLTDQLESAGVLFGKAGVSAGVAVARDSFKPSSGLNSVVGLDGAGTIPGSGANGAAIGDVFFSFVIPGTTIPATTDFVSFTIGDAGGDLDVFQIRSYDTLNALIDVQNVSGAARFPVTISVAGIHRVEVDFTGQGGYSLDDLSFDTPAGGSCGVGCKVAGKSLLVLTSHATNHAKDKLTWKWLKGAATTSGELGSPTSTTTYTLCLHAGSGVASVALPAGSKWRTLGTRGFKFKDPSGTHDGARTALLKSGTAGKAKALVMGKGPNLPDTLVPMLSLPVTAQLVNDTNGTCFEATYGAADVIKNDSTQFKAKTH